MRSRWQLWVGGVAVLLAAALVAFLLWPHRHSVSPDDLKRASEALADMGPLAFFGCMAILPLFWAPMSPFLLLAPVFGPTTAVVGSLLAISINMSLAWLVSGKLFRPFFERLVGRFGYSAPQLSDRSMLGVAVMLRITPGVPFPLQNYLLGLARMPYGKYMLVSLPINGTVSLALIFFGGAVLEGNFGLALLALALLVFIALMLRHLRARQAARGG